MELEKLQTTGREYAQMLKRAECGEGVEVERKLKLMADKLRLLQDGGEHISGRLMKGLLCGCLLWWLWWLGRLLLRLLQ